MASRFAPLFSCAAIILAGSSAWAQDRTETRGLREMATDRPDTTESPFTVDARHVQLEMSAAQFTTDRADGVRTTEWDLAPLNLRYGVDDAVEVGIFVSPYVRVQETPSGHSATVTGAGDVTLRTKVNFFGNDGKGTALGAIADAKLPTAARRIGNNHVEPALTLPVAFELGGGWDAGAMTRVEYTYTGADKYRPVWVNTITCGHDLTSTVGGYVELTSAAGDGGHQATFDCGVTRKLDANTQIDFGVNIGISASAPDLAVFAGVSRRW